MTVFQLALLACTTIVSPLAWGGIRTCDPHTAELYASKNSCEAAGKELLGKIRHQFYSPAPVITEYRCSEVVVQP